MKDTYVNIFVDNVQSNTFFVSLGRSRYADLPQSGFFSFPNSLVQDCPEKLRFLYDEQLFVESGHFGGLHLLREWAHSSRS